VILVDTSAWVEFDRGTGSPVDRRVEQLLSQELGVATTEPIVVEVLAGARDDRRAADLRRLLLRCQLLNFDPVSDFEAAARLYRQCRNLGVTPGGMIDCMIGAVAWRTGASLLAHDVDLARLAAVMGVEMDPASHRPG
jgi:predicted nucleic acid-binding protein